jgi:hypothetical protein
MAAAAALDRSNIMPLSEECEVRKNASAWRRIRVNDALPLKGKIAMRCVECGGAVRPHEAAKDGTNAAHFEHLEAHGGCSIGSCFSGIASAHPHPVR